MTSPWLIIKQPAKPAGCFHRSKMTEGAEDEGKLLTATQTADDVEMQNDAVVDTTARSQMLLHTLDVDILMSICRFLSGSDVYRLALTAKSPFFSTTESAAVFSKKTSNLSQSLFAQNSVALLDFGRGAGLGDDDFSHQARLPIGIMVRVTGGTHAMRLGVTVESKPAWLASTEETSPVKHATVQLDGGGCTCEFFDEGSLRKASPACPACCLVPYTDLQLLNTELFDYLQRALSFDSRAARVLGYSLTEGDGGLPESPFDGAFWIARAACMGDSWCERWGMIVDGEAHEILEPSELFRTLTEVEAWGGWSAYDGIDCDSSHGSSIKDGEECSDQGSIASCRTFADDDDGDVDAEMQEADQKADSGEGKVVVARTGVVARLFHQAMKTTLANILLDHNLQLEDIFPPGSATDSEGRPQVLIAGSAAVQAVLGKRWGRSDIDVFCTWEAAPLVRNRLVASGLICNHCGSHYGDLAPLPDAGMFVDHVEGYGKPGDEDGGFSMKKALEYGEAHVRDKGRGNKFHDNFLIFGFRRPGIPGGAGSRGFPCDFGSTITKIELIIGKECSKDARDLLRSFDLTICKTSFDGETFRVPAPHDTFNAKTAVDPSRYTVSCRVVKGDNMSVFHLPYSLPMSSCAVVFFTIHFLTRLDLPHAESVLRLLDISIY